MILIGLMKKISLLLGFYGARRYAWVFPKDIDGRYKNEEAQYELNFYLPKGCYATVLIEELAKRKLL